MRIIICDDDSLVSNQLKEYIKNYFEQHKLKCPEIVIYENGEALLSDEHDKDIVFLDIEMPGLSGIIVGMNILTMQCAFMYSVICQNPWTGSVSTET